MTNSWKPVNYEENIVKIPSWKYMEIRSLIFGGYCIPNKKKDHPPLATPKPPLPFDPQRDARGAVPTGQPDSTTTGSKGHTLVVPVLKRQWMGKSWIQPLKKLECLNLWNILSIISGSPQKKWIYMNSPSLLLLSNNEANSDKPLDSWMPYGTVPPF